jgi:ribosomal-protein-alanine N-acetyltransferase
MTGTPVAMIVIEPVARAHQTLLAALHGRCFPIGWSEATFAELLSLPNSFGLIATLLDNGAARPVGFALARVAADESELLTIGVVPDAQRRGIARRLIAACVERVANAGAHALFLEVGENNPPARALYEGLGFRTIGRRQHYYRLPDGSLEDALVMRRDLIA